MIDLLIDPLVWVTIALFTSILLALYLRRCARCAILLSGILLLLIALASPYFANRWLSTLEDQYASAACTAEANQKPTVVLAGGISGGYSNLGVIQRLSEASKNRALAAASIVPNNGLLFLSGGSLRPGQPNEADAMAELIRPMIADGVKLIAEVDSTSTYTNAISIGNLFDQMNLEREIVLISSASHMPRAAATFKQQNFKVCAHSVDPKQSQVYSWTALLPQVTAIQKTSSAIHEWSGFLYYRQAGWL